MYFVLKIPEGFACTDLSGAIVPGGIKKFPSVPNSFEFELEEVNPVPTEIVNGVNGVFQINSVQVGFEIYSPNLFKIIKSILLQILLLNKPVI